MREILFRGQDLRTGELVFGNLIQGTVDGRKFCQIEKSDSEDFSQWEVNPETVGQYTGLRDKNGVRIFEGDILSDGTRKMQVYWNTRFASFALDSKDWTFSHFFAEAVSNGECEVIGNIFTHPHPINQEAAK